MPRRVGVPPRCARGVGALARRRRQETAARTLVGKRSTLVQRLQRDDLASHLLHLRVF